MDTFLIKFYHCKIIFCTEKPDYDDVPIVNHDWSNTSYTTSIGKIPLLDDAPESKGNLVVLSHWYDVYFIHNVTMILSVKPVVSGCFYMTNILA